MPRSGPTMRRWCRSPSRALQSLPPERAIRTVHLIVDDNPAPLAAVFKLGPALGSVDLSARVRVNTYTNVRAVAETGDGRLWMVARFVKAAGGCSAPSMKDAEQAMARLGKMKVRSLAASAPGLRLASSCWSAIRNIPACRSTS